MALRPGHRRRALIVAALLGTACKPSSELGGRLDWRWVGVAPDSGGRFSSRGIARWCVPDKLLMLSAESGDTGVGIALHLAGEPKVDSVPVGAEPTLPRAMMAARLADKAHLVGWVARAGGWVKLTAVSAATVSGTFAGQMDGRESAGPVNGRGQFTDLPLVRVERDCVQRFVVPPR